MNGAQDGIFDQSGTHHHYLEFRLDTDIDASTLKSALRDIVENDVAGQTLVVAFSKSAWSVLAPDDTLTGLDDFKTISGVEGFQAPSTQCDIWIWIQGRGLDSNLDRAMKVCNRLDSLCYLEIEVQGYDYHGDRDLIGFVDGTANPKTPEDRALAALAPERNGGSFLLTQKWVHDLNAFNKLNIQRQEAVVGRTKEDDVELEGEAMPADSHVSRTDASENGVALKIWRRSSPFGNTRENGLYFVAFACDIRRFDVQLQRMYGTSGDGLHDRIIHYSKAVSGSYWYVPGVGELTEAVRQ